MRVLLTGWLVLIAACPVFAQKEFGFDNRKGSGQPYLKPEETVARFTVPPEFEVKLFAGEPLMTNPIAFTIDERGRIWIVESFEYPKRTPKGKMPRDRIVILEDTDGDGVADSRKVFAEGKDFPKSFDMASGIEVGHGGVYLGAPPYLWFIENKDDKPGKFEILAQGFGSEDTHETLNTFQWGPDGWLYGLHGVFTQSNVVVASGGREAPDSPPIKMNAAVWRFHPKTKKFEIFSEGTSNPWGMDWRNTDGQFIMACCVIPHLYHMVPGGIYQRQGGTSNNPYHYGYLKEISDHTFHRESGWAHAGLISLDVPHMPERFRNSVIFGSIHGCSLKQNILKPNGSSYIASRGDDFLQSGDKNFRPINLKWGPLGDIYLIDWHDQNPCHQTKPDDWDYERGRVYRIQLKGTTPKKAEDLGKKTPDELFEMRTDPNPYRYRTAMKLLADFPSETLEKLAKKHLFNRPNYEWTLHDWWTIQSMSDGSAPTASGGELVGDWSRGESQAVCWIVRVIGNSDLTDDQPIRTLAEATAKSRTATLRRELASAAIRLADKHDVTPLVHALMLRKEDANDPLIPHLTWLAYEKILANEKASGKASGGREPADSEEEKNRGIDVPRSPEVKNQGADAPRSPLETELAWLAEQAPNNIFVRDQILPKVMRRLVATGQPKNLALCLKFLADVTDTNSREKALDGLAIALNGQTVQPPASWAKLQAELRKDPRLVSLTNKVAVSFRDPQVFKRMLALMSNRKKSPRERIEAIQQVAAYADPNSVAGLLKLVADDPEEAVRVEAVRALGGINNKDVAVGLVSNWQTLAPAVRAEAVNVLAGRKEWATALLSGMEAKVIDRTLITDNTISRMQALNDKKLNAMIESVWGRTRATPDELNKLIDKTRADINSKPGSFERGAKVFEMQCAKCHKFEGKGNEVGPQLDGAGRDIEYLLGNILDPNRVIGAPYFVRQVNTLDGQVLQGVLAEEDPNFLTLKIENAVLKKIAKNDIDGEVKVLEKSMMPEGLGYNLTPENFRDLIRYTMAHPFITAVTVDGKPVSAPVGGRIPLPNARDAKPIVLEAKFTATDDVTTKLLVGAGAGYTIAINGKVIGKGQGNSRINPDGEAFDVTLPKGEHTLTLTMKGGGALYARFLDPNRKLRYPEGN